MRINWVKQLLVLLIASCAPCVLAQPRDPENYGEFAPPDAYENGSKHAYYGSENEWGPRQFTAEEAEGRDLRHEGSGQVRPFGDREGLARIHHVEEVVRHPLPFGGADLRGPDL